MNRILVLIAVAIIAACVWLTPASPTSGVAAGEKESADQKFIRTAGEIDLTEMKLGKMAQENAGSDVVKKFGERTMTDHKRMNGELVEMAGKKGFTVPKNLDKKHQELADHLSKLRGMEFDKAYTKDMVAGHKDAIKMFEAEAKNGSDPAVKAWAEKCVPILQEHLRLAQSAVKDVWGKSE